MRRLLASACALMMGTPLFAAQTYGLVIGIDDYTYIPDLHGAVNDARDIADALDGIGADVTLLLDAEATRSAVLGAWQNIISRAEAGDRLIVTYAGHGSNEPEHTVGNEADGRDENFLLAGFAPRGEAAGERIRDDEIADLIAAAPDLDVIIVADACHAGTVTRDLTPTLGFRYVTPVTLEGDPLPPPPPRPVSDDNQNGVALFLAAVNETEKVPEYLIDGQARGALSFAFADGLRGNADTNRDLVLTKGELETHVRRLVRQISDGVQLPQSLPAGAADTALLELRGFTVAPAPDRTVAFADLPIIKIGGARQMGNFIGAQHNETQPDLTLRDATLFSMVGDPLAQIADPAQLQRTIDKYRLAQGLMNRAAAVPAIGFAQGNGRHKAGSRLTIEVADRSAPFLTLINVASDGAVSLLYPDSQHGDPTRLPIARDVALTVAITAPFGSDHVIAVETPQAATVLNQTLAAMQGDRDMAQLWDVLHQTPGATYAVFPFFSEGQ